MYLLKSELVCCFCFLLVFFGFGEKEGKLSEASPLLREKLCLLFQYQLIFVTKIVVARCDDNIARL